MKYNDKCHKIRNNDTLYSEQKHALRIRAVCSAFQQPQCVLMLQSIFAFMRKSTKKQPPPMRRLLEDALLAEAPHSFLAGLLETEG